MSVSSTIERGTARPASTPGSEQTARKVSRAADLRLMAIDPNACVAEAYGSRLDQGDGFVFLGVLSNASATEQAISRLRPDICLISLGLNNGSNAAQVLREIADAHPRTRRLLITDDDSLRSAPLAAALAEEPDGVFSMAAGLDKLVAAVEAIASGSGTMPRELAKFVSKARQVSELFPHGERQVVCALARYGSKEDAVDKTFYSAETVNTYVRRARKRIAGFEKREALRLPELIVWARDHGFHRVEFAG